MRLLSATRLLIVMALLLSLAIGFFFYRAVEVLRTDRWDAALRHGENLTHVLEPALRNMLQGADQGLLSVQRRWEKQRAAGQGELADLFDGVLSPHELSHVWLVDAQGRILDHVCQGQTDPQAPLPAVFHNVHQFVKQDGLRDLQVGHPLVAENGAQVLLPLARALFDSEGQRAGAIVGLMPLNMLDQLFHALRLGQGSALMLLRANGAVLLHYEQSTAEGGYQRRYQGLPPLRDSRFLLSSQDKISTEMTDPDGVERLYHFQRLLPFPLLVAVGQPRQAILDEWRLSAWRFGGYALSLLLACWVLVLLLRRELRSRQRIQERLQAMQHDLQTIFDNLPSVICYWDTSLHCRYINNHSLLWYGHSADETRGKHVRELLSEEAFEHTRPYLERALQGLPQLFERTFTDTLGGLRHVYVSYTPDVEEGEIRGIFVLVTDITERKRMEDVLFEEKERMRLTLQAIGDAVLCTDPQGRVIFLNPVAEQMTGWQAFDAAGQAVHDVASLQLTSEAPADGSSPLHPMCEALTQQRNVGPVRGAVTHQDGVHQTEVEVSAAPIVDRQGVLAGGVLVLRNVTETVALAERMTQLAQYDTLTGLPNRLLLEVRARDAMAQARHTGKGLAVMYLDLDGFKEVNDCMGHDMGDDLLVQFAQRLASTVRSSDTVCRLGGDEFLLLLPGVSQREHLHTIAAKTLELCQQPFMLRDGAAHLGISAGIALYPEHGDRFETVMRHADEAMYAAKRAGRQRVCLYQGKDVPVLVLQEVPNSVALPSDLP